MTQEERFDTALALYGAEMYGEAFLMLKALAEEGYSDPEALKNLKTRERYRRLLWRTKILPTR